MSFRAHPDEEAFGKLSVFGKHQGLWASLAPGSRVWSAMS